MARRLALLGLVSALAVAGPGCDQAADGSADDGSDDVSASDLIGGAPFTKLPAIAVLVHGNQEECTATLFTKRRAVTAGHCCHGVRLANYELVVGPTMGNVKARIPIAECRAHPQFRMSDLSNDIGLVILDQDAPVDPIPLNETMDASWVERELLFVGYGATDHDGNAGYGVKRAAQIPLANVGATTFRYTGKSPMTCWGDSGGPALGHDASGTRTIAGVTSWGDEKCNHVGVDTRVDTYLPFLRAP